MANRIDSERIHRVYEYIYRKLIYVYVDKKGEIVINKRPKEIKYNEIAKELKLSYKQVRTIVDELVLSGHVYKFGTFCGQNKRKNYYQLPEQKKDRL